MRFLLLSAVLLSGIYSSAFAQKRDEGITGKVHEQNVGKVLFTKNPIQRGTRNETINNPSVYTSEFVLGDRVYSRFFLDKGMNKYPIYDESGNEQENVREANGENMYDCIGYMYVDGKPLLKPDRPFNRSSLKLVEENGRIRNKMVPTTGQMYVLENSDQSMDKDVAPSFAALSDGKHTVRVEIYMGTEKVHTKAAVAKGEFTYTKKNSGVKFESLEAGMKDPELEAKMVKEVQRYSTAQGWKETFVKAKITSEDWDIVHNESTGAILSRSISSYVYAKWPDGHCSYQLFSFSEDYNGSGYQSKLKYTGAGEQKSCDCSK